MEHSKKESAGLIRDIPLIERYSRHNEAENMQFRNYLKTELDWSNKDLDKYVKKETEEVWSQIDCTDCAHCCKNLMISVDRDDIKKLAQRLKMPMGAFYAKYVHKSKTFGELELKESPCVFLGEDNRCTVYEDRPKACRDYPYLYEEGFRSRSLTMIDNTAVCPIVFNVFEALKNHFGHKWRHRHR